ncbi:hypothetical protein Y1Q_0019744 [Alligator mississippiensis]|uniref:Uncharacterized protein n=1 Tax=Alligator mississippiensis TaxID=8496 RepID=A0A151PFU5_ALLMI|nr:hypothetical protein Y1Q_0019744 [Alligator mississippiensis]
MAASTVVTKLLWFQLTAWRDQKALRGHKGKEAEMLVKEGAAQDEGVLKNDLKRHGDHSALSYLKSRLQLLKEWKEKKQQPSYWTVSKA